MSRLIIFLNNRTYKLRQNADVYKRYKVPQKFNHK